MRHRNEKTEYKCWNSPEKYGIGKLNSTVLTQFTSLCSNDTRFYQVCGLVPVLGFGTWQFKSNDTHYPLCSYYLCDSPMYEGKGLIAGHKVLEEYHCNRNSLNKKCANGHINMGLCDLTINVPCAEGSDAMVEKSKVCDGIIDCLHGLDEVNCHHSYGLTCSPADFFVKMKYHEIWLPPEDICFNHTLPDHRELNTLSFCENQEDWNATNCKSGDSAMSCKRKNTAASPPEETRPLFESQTCGPYNHLIDQRVCMDGTDQINCTNRAIWYECDHEDIEHDMIYKINLTDTVLCEKKLDRLCTDDINNKCAKPEVNCHVHRHFLCDKLADCEHQLDEEYCEELQTELTCVRRIRNKSDQTKSSEPLPILKDWVLDNIKDCEGGEDEDPNLWKKCQYKVGVDQIKEDYTYKRFEDPCPMTFYCETPGDQKKDNLLDTTKMCDGHRQNDCQLASSSGMVWLCKLARDKDVTVHAITDETELYKYVQPCIPGLSKEQDCKEYILEESHGTLPIKIIAPSTSSLSCTDRYGENYVYAACLGLCLEQDIVCPLELYEVDHAKSCVQMDRTLLQKDRTLTLTKNNKLTFVEEYTKAKKGFKFKNRELFPCANGQCVSYSQVCDLINDCGDNSDEKHCGNHFSCDVQKREIIKASQKCDGIIHCSNSADECDPDCKNHNKRLITSVYLQIFAWCFGIPAASLNVIVLLRNVRKLSKNKDMSKIKFTVTVLISLVAFGDFLLGLYMILISIENISINDKFCEQENEWLTSSRCEVYGVISTFGSQLSVVAITAMSIYRAIAMRKIGPSRGLSRCFLLMVVIFAGVISIASFLVAALPTNPSLRAGYFYNGYYIPDTNLYFSPKKNEDYAKLLDQVYPSNLTTENMTDINAIKSLLKKMFLFPEDSTEETLVFSTLGFYGSSGSCIFKYFVDPKDPQRSFSWAILIFNFICMVVVALSYFSVHLLSQKSAAKVGVSRRFGALQRKISLIIISDFFCWTPFILICILHYTNKINATPYYSFFSIVVLPINSLINPILYDNFFMRTGIRLCRGIESWRSTLSNCESYRGEGISLQERSEGQTAVSQTQSVLTNITAC